MIGIAMTVVENRFSFKLDLYFMNMCMQTPKTKLSVKNVMLKKLQRFWLQ